MKSHSGAEIRRCRPFLGTFVDIAAYAVDDTTLERGVDAAFAAVRQVHRLMSFHEPTSDVSRMNRSAFPWGVRVHPWTWEVMRAAQNFARESNGAFDVTVGAVLANTSHLPEYGYDSHPAATSRDIFLRKNNEVFFKRALAVDLGGIAKGFAVDRAVGGLIDAGVSSGIVNAGGDIRIFGSEQQVIHIRHPDEPNRVAGAIVLSDRAIATSATYFTKENSALIDGRTREPATHSISVTVGAGDCMTADALTKVVFALREESSSLLIRYGADALVLERNGRPCWMFRKDAP